MLAALPVMFGFQLLLGFLGMDVANVPRKPLQGRLFGSVYGRHAAHQKIALLLHGGHNHHAQRLADAAEREHQKP